MKFYKCIADLTSNAMDKKIEEFDAGMNDGMMCDVLVGMQSKYLYLSSHIDLTVWLHTMTDC